MFCSRCGNQMAQNARFCTKCGFELRRAIPTQVKQSPTASKLNDTDNTGASLSKKASQRLRLSIAIVIGIICYFIGSSLATDLHRYLNTKGATIEPSQAIMGAIGYIMVISGSLSVLVGIKGLIATSKYPPNENAER